MSPWGSSREYSWSSWLSAAGRCGIRFSAGGLLSCNGLTPFNHGLWSLPSASQSRTAQSVWSAWRLRPLSRFESTLRLNVSACFTVTLISEIRRTNAVAVMAYKGFWSLVRNFTDDQTVGGYYPLQPSPRA